MNPNDTREMLESIPSCGQSDPDNQNDLRIARGASLWLGIATKETLREGAYYLQCI